MYIYKITCLIDHRIYIGQCVNNVDSTRGYFGGGVHIKNAIKKHERKNFKKEILRICKSERELDIWEIIYIVRYKCCDPKIGYNLMIGSAHSGNKKYSEQTKEKIRKSNTGKKATEETKKKLSIAHTGLKQTQEHIQKRIETKFRNRTTCKGKIISKEIREAISKKLKGRSLPEEVKEKIRLTCRTPEFREQQRQKRALQVNLNLGKVFSEEARKNMSEARKRLISQPGYIHPMTGSKLSKERQQKMLEAKMKKKKLCL